MAASSGASGASVQFVATDAIPISLGANGSATDLWTWTHNNGRRAVKIEVLEAVGRGLIAASSVAVGGTLVGKAVIVTQASVNAMAIQNQSTAAIDVVLRVTWEEQSSTLMAPAAGSVGVLS